MNRQNVLDHPELSKAWVALESSSPKLDWDDLTGGIVEPRRIRIRRILAVAALAVVVVFVSGEAIGVFAARRAIASGSAVSDQTVALEITDFELPDPEIALGAGDGLITTDLGVTSSMIAAYLIDPSSGSPWGEAVARLTTDGWELLDVDLGLVFDSTVFGGRELILGFRETLVQGLHQPPDRDYAVYEIPPGSDQPRQLHVFDDAAEESVFLSISAGENGLVVTSRTDDSLNLWYSEDGKIWTAGKPFASGVVNGSVTSGDQTLLVGSRFGLIPVEEFGTHAIWRHTGGVSPEPVDIAGLRSLGFGYVIGGFRLSDGLENVLAFDHGFIAYTGYLQVWDGFSGGIALEPREAWSSLVVTSIDGITWEAHLLSDFGINQIVPFGEGLLAVAARRPESDTRTVEAEDGTTVEVAVAPPSTLYYSEDGLIWRSVKNSPEFSKPLLVRADDGRIIAVDEHAVEDREADTTTVYVITAP